MSELSPREVPEEYRHLAPAGYPPERLREKRITDMVTRLHGQCEICEKVAPDCIRLQSAYIRGLAGISIIHICPECLRFASSLADQ